MENNEVTETKVENKDETKCEHHADENLLEDPHEGTVVCSSCGVVVVDQMISGVSEWRTFGDDNRTDIWERSRVGGAANRFLSTGANLTTRVASNGPRTGESFNATILRAINRKSVDNGIWHGLRELDVMADRIHLTESVLEYAHYLYYKMYKKAQFKGIALHTDAKVAACLYIACYHAHCPRTVTEMSAISEKGPEPILRAIQRIANLLNLPVGPIECCHLMPRYCAWLSLPHKIEREAITIAETMTSLDTKDEFTVETISAAAIYLASNRSKTNALKRTPAEVGDCLGVTPTDLLHCYRHFCKK